MADFYGVQYKADPLQAQLNNKFTSTLNSDQIQKRKASMQASSVFEKELTPAQKAAQQKFLTEKLEGAPKYVWQLDQKIFLSSLSPKKLADRQAAGIAQKAFSSTLSAEQKDLSGASADLRDASVLKQLNKTA